MIDPTKAVVLVAAEELLAAEIQPLTAVEQWGEGTKKAY